MGVPMMPWDRKLLSVAEEVTSHDPVSLTVVVGVLVAVVLVVLLVLCVCGDSGGKSKLQTANNQDVEQNHEIGQAETDCVNSAEIRAKTQNGKPANRNSTGQSRSSQISTGSNQMRPTSLRELPEPPVQNGHPATVTEATDDPRPDNGDEEDDDYDHLLGSKKKPVNRSDNYDHVQLDSSNPNRVVSPSKSNAQPCENYYTQVRERTYEVVKDATSKNSESDGSYAKVKDANTDHYSSVSEVKESSDIDPYDTVVDGSNDDTKGATCKQITGNDPYPKVSDVDPYTKVKDNDPYAKVKDNDPYSKVKDNDPYSKVKDGDPYTKVKDNNPYAKVKESIFDPYAHINDGGRPDNTANDDESGDLDPYSTVDDDTGGNKTVNVQLLSSLSDGNVSSPSFELLPTGSMSLEFPQLPVSDEYAVVTKTRHASSSGGIGGMTQPRSPTLSHDSNVIPEEPPRSYHLNEIQQVTASTRNSGAACDVDTEGREYTMVTARESLASMTARNALNPYEIVPDNDGTENMYATVDGSSGDGVIRRNPPDTGSSPRTPSRLLYNQRSSDMYTEIGGPYNDVDVPAPPSVDSLHLMRRQQNDTRGRHLASPEDSGITRSSSDYAVVNKRSSFSPSATKLPEIPHSSSTGLQEGDPTLNPNVTLDPNYQVVKDSIADMDVENDPNYESVEEAKARAPGLAVGLAPAATTTTASQKPRRQHHYEQVTPATRSPAVSRQNEAAVIRDRVLNSHTYEDPSETVRDRVIRRHMYEDITEVNEQKKELSKSSDGEREKKELGRSSDGEREEKKEVTRLSDGERERYLYKRKKGKETSEDEIEVTML